MGPRSLERGKTLFTDVTLIEFVDGVKTLNVIISVASGGVALPEIVIEILIAPVKLNAGSEVDGDDVDGTGIVVPSRNVTDAVKKVELVGNVLKGTI